MNRLVSITRVLAHISIAFACVALGVELLHLQPVLMHLDDALGKTSVEMDELHVATQRADLTIKEMQYPILQAGLTSKKEADMLDGWNAQITHTLSDVDAAVVTANKSTAAVSDETVAAVRQVNAAVANVNPALNGAANMLRTANAVLSDPAIVGTLRNTQDATARADATVTDVQQAVHRYTHPGWKTRVFNWSMSAVHAIGGWF